VYPRVIVDDVSKKFRRGERHDTLRKLGPALADRVLRRDGVTRSEFWALRHVSFQVNAGEALGIIGPNGSGKSTTLKILTRIIKPTSGSAMLLGRAGVLLEVAAGFHPDLTGRENIYLQGAVMGMTRAEIAAAFDAIVDFSGLADSLETPVKRMSSGMKARLGFSIAAHFDPDVLLLDEVLAVGDAAFQAQCLDRLTQLKADGVALVFVSHSLGTVERLCDRALLLVGGHAIAEGEPRAVREQYLKSV
jgi:lipopolysaccharide transport system ATP-binding protein